MTKTHDDNDDEQYDYPPVAVAIAAAAAEVGAVGKNQKMSAGPAKYNYRGLDDLMDAVHGSLTKVGVTFAPHNVQVIDSMERTTKSGATQYHLRALVTYRVYGPAGDHIEVRVIAEGTDTGDKASNKLMSGAFKYALGQTLSIPYTMDDQDSYISEPVNPPSPAELLARIEQAAKGLGKTVDEVTGKVRAEHGGLEITDLDKVPVPALHAFTVSLERYAKSAV